MCACRHVFEFELVHTNCKHATQGVFMSSPLTTSLCFNQEKHIMSERNVLLKNVKHPFLVGLHYSFQTADKLYFILDYINGGEVSY